VSEDERLEQMRRRWDDCRQSRDHLATRVLLLEGLLRDLMKYQRGGHPFRQDEIDAVRAALLGKQAGEAPAAGVSGSYLAGVPCLYETAEECPDIDCSHNVAPAPTEGDGEVCGACGGEGFIMGEGTCIPCRGTGRTPKGGR
jgi:hypothetical protein